MKKGSLIKRIRNGQLGIITDITYNPHKFRFIHVRWKKEDGTFERSTIEKSRVFEVLS